MPILACGRLVGMSDKAVPAPVKPFLERLGEGVVVFDGAMGTMLYARGVFVNRCFDELNLSNPNLVRSIHEEYLAAGAEVVETNTFGAHRFKLGPHGLAPHVRKINREGARVAREAAEGRGLVAGSIGPIGKPLAPLGHVTRDEATEAYREQVEGLVEGGVDLFFLETMPSLAQAEAALEAVRSIAPEVPVIVSLTFNEEGLTLYGGDTPEDVVHRLEALDVPVIGANCSQGPQAMLDTLQRMATAARSARLSAMPNAGSPALVEGRYVYLCTPEYMATWARRFLESGASVVGGCCGTTPAHVKDLVRSVRMVRPARAEVRVEAPRRPEGGPDPDRPRGQVAPRPQPRPEVRRLGGAGPAPGGQPRGAARAGAVLPRERGRRHQRRRRPARLGPHERPGPVRAPPEPGGDRHDPPLHLPRPEPPRHPVGPARGATPSGCATSWPSPATPPSSATTPTPPRSTTSTRSA